MLPPSLPRASAGVRRPILTIGRGRLPIGPKTIGIVVVVLLALAYGGRELYLRLTHIYEYDARVTADIVTVSSRADGWVVELAVREGQRVKAGDVLTRIDDRAAKLKIDALKAQIASETVPPDVQAAATQEVSQQCNRPL